MCPVVIGAISIRIALINCLAPRTTVVKSNIFYNQTKLKLLYTRGPIADEITVV